MTVKLGILALVVVILGSVSTATAQSLTLSSPGTYVLAADSTSTGVYNVYIAGSDITLDLNGKTIRCAPSSPATAITFGVYINTVTNIVIRNGKITGCFFGLHGSNANYVTLEDIDFSGNTYIGANMAYGANKIVRRCTFTNIAGYTPEAYAIGLNGIGHNGIIENNLFENLYRQPYSTAVGEGVGALIEQGAANVRIRNNTFRNAQIEPNTIGVWIAQYAAASITGNTFTNWDTAVASAGTVTATGNTFTMTASLAGTIAISSPLGSASGNTITGYASGVVGGMVDGGNTVNPLPAEPPPPTSGGKWFRFCLENTTVCYEGILPPAPGSGGV